MTPRSTRLAPMTTLAGVVLMGIFAGMVVHYRSILRGEVRQTIINRDAAVLFPVALRQLAQRESGSVADTTAGLLAAVLETVQQKNMLAVAVFDAQGRTLQYAPDSLLFAELPLDVYAQLLKSEPISRYHPEFPLARYFGGIKAAASQPITPVLEVLLPLHGRDPSKILGFAQYYIDARPLAGELTIIDERMTRLTSATLGIGGVLIASVVIAAYFRLRRAQHQIAERNDRLIRANFELTLAAKASALGQITSHLMHGLQGSVAGLSAVVAGREPGPGAPDWETAAGYTERIQTMIHETVTLLGDSDTHSSYELTGHELAAIVRRRNLVAAEQKGVEFIVRDGFDESLDGHRGGLLCLIISNLVQNSIAATAAGGKVTVLFRHEFDRASVAVTDEGHGIPVELQPHLFEPGHSGQSGGSGLGLAISQLLARQIGATVKLDSTGPSGTTFRLELEHFQ